MNFASSSTAGDAVVTVYNMLNFPQHQHGRQRRHHRHRFAVFSTTAQPAAPPSPTTVADHPLFDNGANRATRPSSTTSAASSTSRGQAPPVTASSRPVAHRCRPDLSRFHRADAWLNDQSSEWVRTSPVTGTGSLVKAATRRTDAVGWEQHVGGTTITGGTLDRRLTNTGWIAGAVDVPAPELHTNLVSDGNPIAVTARLAARWISARGSAAITGRSSARSQAPAATCSAPTSSLSAPNTSTKVSGVIRHRRLAGQDRRRHADAVGSQHVVLGGTTVTEGTLQLGTLARTGSVAGAISVGEQGHAQHRVKPARSAGPRTSGSATSYSNGCRPDHRDHQQRYTRVRRCDDGRQRSITSSGT